MNPVWGGGAASTGYAWNWYPAGQTPRWPGL